MSAHPLDGRLLPTDPDEGLILRSSHYAAYSVQCGYCKAPRGGDCLAAGKYTFALSFHKARTRAVAHLTDREKYDAFAAVRAEHVAAREVVDAELAKPLTPEQQTARAAISAAFAAADERFTAKESAMRERCLQPWLHNEQCRCRQGEPYVHAQPKPHVVREVTSLADVRARKAGAR